MFPLEARHTDIYELREKFGNKVLLMGGVNKLALMNGKEAIDAEIRRLSPPTEAGRIHTNRRPPSSTRSILQKLQILS